jgi:hypothetical protein
MRIGSLAARSLVVVCLVSITSCGGGSSSPSQPTTPAPTPTPTITPTPTPSTPPTGASCPIGAGDVDAKCNRTLPAFSDDIYQAIVKATRDRPEIFNFSQTTSDGLPRVLDAEKYYAAVTDNLRAKGFCAQVEAEMLQLKNSNDFSEQWDILSSNDYPRTGALAYQTTCRPAAFPVDVRDRIQSIRIAFYQMRCPNGKPVPTPIWRDVPVGCVGTVTMSPKDKDNKDVDPLLYRSTLHWRYEDLDRIKVEDFVGEPFNKNIWGVEEGNFAVCASIAGIEGCMNGKVLP